MCSAVPPNFLVLLQQPGSRVNLSSLLAFLRVQLEAKHRAGPTHITPARAWDWELALPIFTSPKMLKQSFPSVNPAHSIYIVFTADISDQSRCAFPIESPCSTRPLLNTGLQEADDAESEVPCGMIFTGHSCGFRTALLIMWASWPLE